MFYVEFVAVLDSILHSILKLLPLLGHAFKTSSQPGFIAIKPVNRFSKDRKHHFRHEIASNLTGFEDLVLSYSDEKPTTTVMKRKLLKVN